MQRKAFLNLCHRTEDNLVHDVPEAEVLEMVQLILVPPGQLVPVLAAHEPHSFRPVIAQLLLGDIETFCLALGNPPFGQSSPMIPT